MSMIIQYGVMVEIFIKSIKNLEKDLTINQLSFIRIIRSKKHTAQKQISIEIGINEKNIRNNISVLKQKKIFRRIETDRYGYWEIIN